MPKKIRELKAILRKAGFECVRIRGSHERWIHPDVPELPITLAGKDSQDAKILFRKDSQGCFATARKSGAG